MRNDGRRVVVNNVDLYEEMLEERDVKYFRQYVTPNMVYPSPREMRQIKTISHVWKKGDRFYKLAHQHYRDSSLWWVIAWFNKKPTESHVEFGEVIYIPLPLERVLQYYDVV